MTVQGKRLAIMQPYFFPYIGYFQLIQAVDQFIVYDNIKYTKKGWINKNRISHRGQEILFSLPLEGASDALDVKDRAVSTGFRKDKFLNLIREAYRNAPHFQSVYPLIENIIYQPQANLFKYIYKSIIDICVYLKIETMITISSSLSIDHSLTGVQRVIALCQEVNAGTYVNAIGGKALYEKDQFKSCGIDLNFLQSNNFDYKQFDSEFIPWLSIIDVMMFSSVEKIRQYLLFGYKLI
jgi:hypothetical protein